MPSSSPPAGDIRDVCCPFCGLLCDDLVVEARGAELRVRANGCAMATAGFETVQAPTSPTPRVNGRAASLAEAAAAAAQLLRQARQPVIAGLGTDVAGMRAATQLADRCGAVLDHMNSAAAMRNLLALQDGGWVTTTLSEIRNHADLLVVAGTDIVSRFPRFFERCIANRETLFGNGRECEVIFLGRGPGPGLTLPGRVTTIACDPSRLHEVFGVLRALVTTRALSATEAAGEPIASWQKLADRMRAARYGVVAWAAADFDFPQAELTVQALCDLVKDLNRKTRFAGLPLGGSDGDLTADAVMLWQTGFSLRTSLAQGVPDHDPHHYAAARMLARGEADLLLWISSLSASRTPPATDAPTVVLGRADMRPEREPVVFIPVGTPGVDHAGNLFRADRVVALPLQQLRSSLLPSVAEALGAIEAALVEAGPC